MTAACEETLPANASLLAVLCTTGPGALPLSEVELVVAVMLGLALALGGVGGQSSAVKANDCGSFSSSDPQVRFGRDERNPISILLIDASTRDPAEAGVERSELGEAERRSEVSARSSAQLCSVIASLAARGGLPQ